MLVGNGVAYHYFSDNGKYEVEAEMLEDHLVLPLNRGCSRCGSLAMRTK